MSPDPTAASVIAGMIARNADSIAKKIRSTIKDFTDEHFKSFKKYYEKSYYKALKTKTLLYKDKSVDLPDIYVETNLLECSSRSKLDTTGIIDRINTEHKLLITATAGAGKSFFAKHLFLTISNLETFVPVLIELRNISDYNQSIISIIQNHLASGGFDTSEKIVNKFLEKKLLLIILDGYDEISHTQIESFNNELKTFNNDYLNIPLILTSRPEERLEYLPFFANYKVLPLTKKQAVALIKKLQYNPEVKTNFIDKLNAELFDKHYDFASNPLLLSLMLMIFRDNAEIPSKMHIFYEEAFSTLFNRHDASKDGTYTRDLKSKLDKHSFIRMLACFSICGQIQEQAIFTEEMVVKYINRAKELTGLNALSAEGIKADILNSFCILVQDGRHYTFAHRSFQEFFSAYFLLNFPTVAKTDVFIKLFNSYFSGGVIYLAYNMNKDYIEQKFIFPALSEFIETCNHPRYNKLGFLHAYCFQIELTLHYDHFTYIYKHRGFAKDSLITPQSLYLMRFITFITTNLLDNYNISGYYDRIAKPNDEIQDILKENGLDYEYTIQLETCSDIEYNVLKEAKIIDEHNHRLNILTQLLSKMRNRLNIDNNNTLDDII